MKKVMIAAMLAGTVVGAKAEAPTQEQFQAIIMSLRAQRDSANDQVAELNGRLMVLQKERDGLKGEKDRLSKERGELEEQIKKLTNPE